MTIIATAHIAQVLHGTPTERLPRYIDDVPMPAAVTQALAWSTLDTKTATGCPTWCVDEYRDPDDATVAHYGRREPVATLNGGQLLVRLVRLDVPGRVPVLTVEVDDFEMTLGQALSLSTSLADRVRIAQAYGAPIVPPTIALAPAVAGEPCVFAWCVEHECDDGTSIHSSLRVEVEAFAGSFTRVDGRSVPDMGDVAMWGEAVDCGPENPDMFEAPAVHLRVAGGETLRLTPVQAVTLGEEMAALGRRQQDEAGELRDLVARVRAMAIAGELSEQDLAALRAAVAEGRS